MRSSLFALALAAAVASPALAGNKVLKNDNFTGAGGIFSGLSLGEYQGAGVLFTPDPADYPLKVVGVDVLVVPYNGGTAIPGAAYQLSIWDESGGTLTPPTPNDGGITYFGLVNGEGVGPTASTTAFSRYTLAQPLIITQGKVFVQFSEQLSTMDDNTTIALDSSPSPKPGANWFFTGVGTFEPFDQGDGGYYGGLNRNWIVRLVLEVPDTVVTVTSITPSSAPTTAQTSTVIAGTNFELGAKAFLGTNELALTSVNASTIGATVPMGLTPGVYDVTVKNLSGAMGTLARGFTVLLADGGMPVGGGTGGGAGGGAGGGGGSTGNEALALTAITPTQVYEEDATALFLTGAGFKAGASLLIGGTRIDGPVVESGGVISASLVARTLKPGQYDVSVINLNGEQATLPNAFKVLAGSKAAPKGCTCSEVDALPLLLVGALALRRRGRGRTSSHTR